MAGASATQTSVSHDIALRCFISSRRLRKVVTNTGCVAKIFKLIKIECVIAAKTNPFRENEYTFYLFYPCSIVDYISF